jgi:hypothetical protein
MLGCIGRGATKVHSGDENFKTQGQDPKTICRLAVENSNFLTASNSESRVSQETTLNGV